MTRATQSSMVFERPARSQHHDQKGLTPVQEWAEHCEQEQVLVASVMVCLLLIVVATLSLSGSVMPLLLLSFRVVVGGRAGVREELPRALRSLNQGYFENWKDPSYFNKLITLGKSIYKKLVLYAKQ